MVMLILPPLMVTTGVRVSDFWLPLIPSSEAVMLMVPSLMVIWVDSSPSPASMLMVPPLMVSVSSERSPSPSLPALRTSVPEFTVRLVSALMQVSAELTVSVPFPSMTRSTSLLMVLVSAAVEVSVLSPTRIRVTDLAFLIRITVSVSSAVTLFRVISTALSVSMTSDSVSFPESI